MVSIVVPIFICLHMCDSEGDNERAYVPKIMKTKGLQLMISFLHGCIANLGNKLLKHADNMPTRHIRRMHGRRNLGSKSGKSTSLVISLLALACQAEKTH